MFTGIVQSMGTIRQVLRQGPDITLLLDRGDLRTADVHVGDSVAVNGVCLTVASMDDAWLSFDISAETVSRSTFSELQSGNKVNLELALLPSTRIGGHFMTGHVDGVGECVERIPVGRSVKLRFRAPDSLSRFVAEKGSIAVDGVSLTVNAVEDSVFEVNIVPYTLDATTLGQSTVGQRVHLEVDLIARYIERLLRAEEDSKTTGVDEEFLYKHGFVGSSD